jgi:prepilin-type N-terminal cleavage/methylation domain-containing protein
MTMRHFSMRAEQCERGMTLVELLIAVAIVGVVVGGVTRSFVQQITITVQTAVPDPKDPANNGYRTFTMTALIALRNGRNALCISTNSLVWPGYSGALAITMASL